MKKNVSRIYLVCTVLFVTCLLLSNIAAVKLIAVGPLTLPAGVLMFPITYILNDVLSEVYGYKMTKFTIFLGFAMNLFMSLYFTLTIYLPAPVFFKNQEAYASILGNTPRILFASLCAYLVGTTLNAKIMVKMKGISGENKGLFMRCVLSTLVGESFDSLIFVTLGFFGNMPLRDMFIMVVTQATVKTVYEIIIFPITSQVIKKIKSVENVAV